MSLSLFHAARIAQACGLCKLDPRSRLFAFGGPSGRAPSQYGTVAELSCTVRPAASAD